MWSPFPNLVKGGIGKVQWHHFMRIFRAVEKVEAIAPATGLDAKPIGSFWAKLLVLSSGSWTWERVRYTGSGTPANASGYFKSSDFPTGSGLALDFTGAAAANDIVLLHELPSTDGLRWFAVVSGAGGSSTALPYVIQSSSSLGGTPERWRYVIKQGEMLSSSTGIITTVGGATAIYAYNLAEDTGGYAHGQDLTPGGSTLTPSACTGVVMAWDSGETYSGSSVYLFDAPNPMDVTCNPSNFDAMTQFLTMGA